MARGSDISSLLVIFLVLAGSGQAQDEATKKPTEPSKTADAAGSAAARAALAKFEAGNGDWKVRMGAWVSLARIGPTAVPVLVEALKGGPPATRELAAKLWCCLPTRTRAPHWSGRSPIPRPAYAFTP